MCRPYGFGNHADMTETTLRPITNSGIWIPMLSPTCSTMISSDEPLCRGFKQSHIQFLLSIGMLLARDSIVGIFIPSSISLLASHFTPFIIHHLMTNSLVVCLQVYDVYYWEGPEIPLRYSEWQILISVYANSTNTFEDTCRASLWSPSYVVMFDSTQGIPPVSGSCIIS